MSTQNKATTVSRRRVGTLGTLFIASALTACGGGGGGSAAPSGPLDVVPDPVVTPAPDPVVTPTPDPVVSTDPTDPDFIKGDAVYDYTDPALYDFSDGTAKITLNADEFNQSGMAYHVKFREDAHVTVEGLVAENIDIRVEGSETFVVGESLDQYILEKDIPDNVTIIAPDAESVTVYRLADENFTVKGNNTVTVNTAKSGFSYEGNIVNTLNDVGFEGDINAETRIFINGDDHGFSNFNAPKVLINGDLGFASSANADGEGVTVAGDATLGSIINAPEGATVILGNVVTSARITTETGAVGGTFDRAASIEASNCFNFEGGFTGDGETPDIQPCEDRPQANIALQLTGGMR